MNNKLVVTSLRPNLDQTPSPPWGEGRGEWATSCSGLLRVASLCAVHLTPILLTACAHPDLAASLSCPAEPNIVAPVSSSAYQANSISELKDKASAGDLAATRVLGERYEHGDGVVPDLNRAADWYDKAAIIPPTTTFISAPAVGKLSGFLVPVSSGRSNPGDPIAMAELGKLYLAGRGVSVDSTRASVLLGCASVLGVGAEFRLPVSRKEG